MHWCLGFLFFFAVDASASKMRRKRLPGHVRQFVINGIILSGRTLNFLRKFQTVEDVKLFFDYDITLKQFHELYHNSVKRGRLVFAPVEIEPESPPKKVFHPIEVRFFLANALESSGDVRKQPRIELAHAIKERFGYEIFEQQVMNVLANLRRRRSKNSSPEQDHAVKIVANQDVDVTEVQMNVSRVSDSEFVIDELFPLIK